MATEATETQQYSSVLSTPEVKVPPRDTEHHQGEITGVQLFESDNGPVALQIDLTSSDTGGSDNVRVWLPDTFVEFLDSKGDPHDFDPATLPEEEGNAQLSSYRRSISNEDHTATLQSLISMAIDQGRGDLIADEKIDSLESYVAVFNMLLSGTKVIYTKRERKNEDTGQKFFNVTGYFHSPEDINNPKMFKRGRRMWL